MDSKFSLPNYHIRKKVLSLAGAKFHIYDSNQQLVLFSKMKAFKLKEDIRLYSNEDMTEELLTISARKAIDISAIYDVTDAKTGEKVGALQRRGLKSLLKDEWVILDRHDGEIGTIKEDSLGLALVRRFLLNLIPQKFTVALGDNVVSTFKQNVNPFVTKLSIDFTPDRTERLDRRLGLAAGVLLCAIEGKQS